MKTGTLEGGPGGHVAVEMCIYQVRLNMPSTRETAKRPIQGPGNAEVGNEGQGNDEGDDDDGDDDDEGDARELPDTLPKPKATAKKSTAKAKKGAAVIKTAVNPSTYRKTIPKGIDGCLEGVRILFTGTFETMDRVTSLATAKKYGADVVTKLEDTDYIVVGLRAGPKKLQIINELELETISEEEFFSILENGVSEEKRIRMANKRKADEMEEPEEIEKKAKTTRVTGGRKKKN